MLGPDQSVAKEAATRIHEMRLSCLATGTLNLPSELIGECELDGYICQYGPSSVTSQGKWLRTTVVAFTEGDDSVKLNEDDEALWRVRNYSLCLDSILKAEKSFHFVVDAFRRLNHPNVSKLYGWCRLRNGSDQMSVSSLLPVLEHRRSNIPSTA